MSLEPKFETKRQLRLSVDSSLEILRNFISDKKFDIKFNGMLDFPFQWIIVNFINNLKNYLSSIEILTTSIEFDENYCGVKEWRCGDGYGIKKCRYFYAGYEYPRCGKLLADKYGIYDRFCSSQCVKCQEEIIQCVECAGNYKNQIFRSKESYGCGCVEKECVEDRIFTKSKESKGKEVDEGKEEEGKGKEEIFDGVIIYIDILYNTNIFGDGDLDVEDYEFIAKLYENQETCQQINITNLVKEQWEKTQGLILERQYSITSNNLFYESIKGQEMHILVSPNIDLHTEIYLDKYILEAFVNDEDKGKINQSNIRAACDICYTTIVNGDIVYGKFKSKICENCHNRYDICEMCLDSDEFPLCCRNNTDAFGRKVIPFEENLRQQIENLKGIIYFELVDDKCELNFYKNGELNFTRDITDVYNEIQNFIHE